jgi:hypothetical protein
MLFVIEAAFLITGLYALFTAKMPSWVIGKGYKAEGNKVRATGALMATLMPGMFCMGIVVGLMGGMMGFDPDSWAIGIEIITVILVAIIVSIILRNIREPITQPAQTSAIENIESK